MAATQTEILNVLQEISGKLEKIGNPSQAKNDDGRFSYDSQSFFKTWQDARNIRKAELKTTKKTRDKDAVSASLNKYLVAVDSLVKTGTKVISATTDIVYTVLNAQLRKKTAMLNATAELQKRETEVFGKTLADATKVMLGNVTGNIIDTAYQSLNAVMEGGRKYYLKGMQDQLTVARMNTEIANINRQMAGDIVGTVSGAASSIAGMLGPVGSIAGSILSLGSDITRKQLEYKTAQAEWELKLREKQMEVTESYIEQIHSMTDSYKEMSKKITEMFYDLTNESYKYGRTIGMNKESIRDYSNAVIRTNVALSKVGLTYKDLFQMQNTYNENGRTAIISDNEGQLMGGIAYRMGIAANEVASITGAMQTFNISIDSGTEMMYKIAKTANRMGLSTTKFAKDLEKNLKMAERYQFKGGVKGMMDMALQAQKLRFNVNELSGMLEKIQTGNIEDVIQTSAKLNVLGGNAALMSDPMAMLYNAYVDPKQYMENINRMVAGFGSFNKKTGETTFNWNEIARIGAISAATGESKENLMNQARQKHKEKELRKVYGNRLGEYADAIYQNAAFKDGKWIVKLRDDTQEGGFREVSVDDALKTPKLLEEIFPEDKQDLLIDYVRQIANVLSPKEGQENEEKRGRAVILNNEGLVGDLYDQSEKLIMEHYRHIQENVSKYQRAISSTAEATVKAQEIMNQISEENGVLNTYLKLLTEDNGQMEKFRVSLNDSTAIFNKIIEEFLKNGYEGIANLVGKSIKENTAFKSREAKAQLAKEITAIPGTDEYYEALSNIYDVENNLTSPFSNKKTLRKNIEKGIWQVNNNGELLDAKTGKPIFYYGMNEEDKRNGYINNETRAKDFGVSAGLNVVGGPLMSMFYSLYNQTAKKVNDIIISPRNGIFETSPQDTIFAAKPDGPIEKSIGEVKRDIINVNVNPINTIDVPLPESKVALPSERLIEKENTILQQDYSQPQRIVIDGTLKLDSGSQHIDLMEVLRNDPTALRDLAKEVIVETNRTVFGGKHLHAPNRYTFS